MGMDRKKSLFKNWKFLLILTMSLILASGVAFSAFVYVEYTKPLAVPTGLVFDVLPNGEVYASVNKVQGKVRGYEFLLSGSGNPKILFNETNQVEISKYFNKPATYSIKCRAIGMTDKACSVFCEDEIYISSLKISTPQISLNYAQNRLMFSISDKYVEKVILNFTLCYGVNENAIPLTTSNYTLLPGTDELGYYFGYFPLDFLESGEYSLSVKANSTKTGYISSDYATPIVYNTNNVE